MNRPVLLLDQGETLGGAERFLVDFCNEMTPADIRRLRPKIVGAKTAGYQDLLRDEIEVIPFHYPNLKKNILLRPFVALQLLGAARRLKKLIKKTNARAVYSNTPKTHLITWMMMYFLNMRERVEWTLMIHDFTTPKWLLRSIGEFAKTIAVNSTGTREDTRKKLEEQYYSKIRIIENGIDVGSLPEPRMSTGVKNVLIIGRIDRRKGQDYALKAAKILKESYPNVHFSVVGMPFEEDPKTMVFYHELKNYASENDLTNVTFVGELKDPLQAYQETDLVVFTPIDPEPFGRITTESLSMGKAVLAFNETGPREVINQFTAFCERRSDIPLGVQERFLVSPRDAEALAKHIEYFIINPEHMTAIAQHGRSFIANHYPLAETKKRLIQMIEGE